MSEVQVLKADSGRASCRLMSILPEDSLIALSHHQLHVDTSENCAAFMQDEGDT